METSNRMTHYEYTRIRGIRLQQLEDGFAPFVDIDENDSYSDIFDKEVKNNKLPYIIIRTLNDSTKVEVNAEDMIIDVKSKM